MMFSTTVFVAIGVGLLAWLLTALMLSDHPYPNTFSQILLDTTLWHNRPQQGGVITPQLSALIQDILVLEHVAGLSVAVIPKVGEVEFHTWGHRTDDGEAVTPDTLFPIASVSKAFCATALGLLIDDFANGNNVTALPSGLTELTWHTRLQGLLPDWQLVDEWASERANLRDILSHMSGLPGHDLSYGPLDGPQDLIARSRYLRPAFELREKWSYNSIMYATATHVIATYSGQPYASFVEDRIFAPLGMTSSTFSPNKAEASGKLAQGWTKKGRRVPRYLTEDIAFLMAGIGGVISSAVDMTKWISTWIGEGVHENRTIFPLSVYRNTSYSYSVSDDHPNDSEHSITGYGMGWHRNSYRGHDVVHHSGSMPDHSALVSFLPSDGIGVVVFANGGGQGGPVKLISNRILDSALRLTSSLAPPRLVLSPRVFGTTDAWPRPPFSNATTSTEPLKAQSPLLSMEAFAGTYDNPGYGSLVLCGPSSSSSYCARVRSDFSIVDSAQGNPGLSTDLLAEWSRVWFSHVRMQHQQGFKFALCLTSLYPNGYGKDTTPFETGNEVGAPAGWVEFVVQDGKVVGFGLSGLVDQPTERARKYESVQDRADVWFDKI